MTAHAKILICGDSFAADWSCKYPGCQGWPNLLEQQYEICNRAQAGVSEYKIWLQLVSDSISHYTHIILSHTSPYRVPIDRHPLHHQDELHHTCDLIYEDIKARKDPALFGLVEYFEKWMDLDYANFVHQLIIDREIHYLAEHSDAKILHTTNLDINPDLHGQEYRNYHEVFKKNPGLINHYSSRGNQSIADDIVAWIQQR